MKHNDLAGLLRERHYTTLPVSLTRSDVERGATAFLQFLSLPEEIKRTVHFPSVELNGTARGYRDSRDNKKKDRKVFFHWNPSLVRHNSYFELNRRNCVAQTFFKEAARLYRAVETASLAWLEQVQPELIPYLFSGEKKLTFWSADLRFLAYAPKGEGSFCATGHYDKSITFAVGESAPGLRTGCCERHGLTSVQHREGELLCMSGLGLWEYSKGVILPTWHDVVHLPSTQKVEGELARWAIVLFAEIKDARPFTWEETHTPVPH